MKSGTTLISVFCALLIILNMLTQINGLKCYSCIWNSVLTSASANKCKTPDADAFTVSECAVCMTVWSKVNDVETITRSCNPLDICTELNNGDVVTVGCCKTDLCNSAPRHTDNGDGLQQSTLPASVTLSDSETDGLKCYVCSWTSVSTSALGNKCKAPDADAYTLSECAVCSRYWSKVADMETITRSCSPVCTELDNGDAGKVGCCKTDLCNSAPRHTRQHPLLQVALVCLAFVGMHRDFLGN